MFTVSSTLATSVGFTSKSQVSVDSFRGHVCLLLLSYQRASTFTSTSCTTTRALRLKETTRHVTDHPSSTTLLKDFGTFQVGKSKMAASIPRNSVWSSMGYAPPRGPCNHKSGLMSPACPCLRFMLHPVKVSPAQIQKLCKSFTSY